MNYLHKIYIKPVPNKIIFVNSVQQNIYLFIASSSSSFSLLAVSKVQLLLKFAITRFIHSTYNGAK